MLRRRHPPGSTDPPLKPRHTSDVLSDLEVSHAEVDLAMQIGDEFTQRGPRSPATAIRRQVAVGLRIFFGDYP